MALSRTQRLGILQGQAVGDALGAATEFKAEADIVREHGDKITRFLPGSTLGFAPGEFTDDTQMVLCVLAAYHRAAGNLLTCVGQEFAAWADSRPLDVGGLTGAAIAMYRDHGLDGGFRAWAARGYEAAGNGGLMRAAAPVIAGRTGPALREETVLLTALTHADPRSLVACLATVEVLEALAAAEEPREAWTRGLSLAQDYPIAATVAGVFGQKWASAIASRLAAAQANVARSVARGLGGDPGAQGGYVLDTLQAAAHASIAPDFLEGVGRIAARGNDSDTAGAVAGALLAARGLGIPGHLLDRVHSRHRWPLWNPPGSAKDLQAFVPA